MPYSEGPTQAWQITGAADQTARDTFIRTRLQELHEAFLAMGLVEEPDIGAMLDPADLAVPLPNSVVTANQVFSSGFKIYRFDDALQATRPIFLKVAFGGASSSAAAGMPALQIQLAQGTDGSGALTGYTFNGRNYVFGASLSFTVYDSAKLRVLGSMELGLIALLLSESGNNTQTFFCVERLRDIEGEPSEDGIYVQSHGLGPGVWVSYANSVFKTNSPTTGNVGREGFSSASTGWGQPATLKHPNQPAGGSDGLSPIYPHYPFTHRPWPPILAVMGVRTADVSAESSIPVDRYGVNRTYKNVSSAAPDLSGVTSGSLLMLTDPPD